MQLQGRRFGVDRGCGITLFSQSRAMASNLFAEYFANLHLYHAKFCLMNWFGKEFMMHSSHARSEAVENEFSSLSYVGFGSSLYPPTCYSLSWFGSSFTNCKIPPKIGLQCWCVFKGALLKYQLIMNIIPCDGNFQRSPKCENRTLSILVSFPTTSPFCPNPVLKTIEQEGEREKS